MTPDATQTETTPEDELREPVGESVPETAPHDPDPAAEPDHPIASTSTPVVVPRMVQLVLLPVALLLLYVIVSAAGTVVLVFLVSSVIALILNPLVKLVERAHIPHGLAVAAVFLFFFAAFAGAVLLLIQPASDQVAAFQHDVPGLVKSANHTLADFQRWLDDHNINVQVKKQGQTALGTLQSNVLKGSGDVVSFGRDLVQRLVEGAFALILVLVVSVYMLLYAESIGRLVRQVMPTGDGTPEDDFPIRAQKAVSSYVRGQLLFSVIMGTTAGIALYVFGVLGIFPDGRSYALFFGVFFGLMELIPYVGPVLGAVPPIVVALLQDPLTAVWVALLFLALQQIEGHIVAPQVFGFSLRLNPIIVIFALLFGAEAYGIIGALIALPLVAVLRETVVFLNRHLEFEGWSTHPATTGSDPPPPE